MKGTPGCLFVIDPRREYIAVREAVKLGIPVVALCDTNCDPNGIDHVIPGNDDAIKSIELFTGAIAEAAIEGAAAGRNNAGDHDVAPVADVENVEIYRREAGAEEAPAEEAAAEAPAEEAAAEAPAEEAAAEAPAEEAAAEAPAEEEAAEAPAEDAAAEE